MKSKGKKGFAFSVAPELIAILIAAVILIVIVGAFAKVILSSSGKSKCSLSFAIASATKSQMLGMEGIKIDCDSEIINLKFSALDKNIQTTKEYVNQYEESNNVKFSNKESPNFPLEYQINKAIAVKMKDAWSATGEGKLDVFSDNFNPIQNAKTKDESLVAGKKISFDRTRCVIFTTFTFDKELQIKMTQIDSLSEWLKKNKVPGKEGISYYEYLYDSPDGKFPAIDYRYRLDKSLSIVYYRININRVKSASAEFLASPYLLSVLSAAIPGGLIAKGAYVLGAEAGVISSGVDRGILEKKDIPESKAGLFLMPSDEIGKQCDELMN